MKEIEMINLKITMLENGNVRSDLTKNTVLNPNEVVQLLEEFIKQFKESIENKTLNERLVN